MTTLWRESLVRIVLSLSGLPLAAAPVWGQSKSAPKAAQMELVVQKQVSSSDQPRPFGSVGLFDVIMGVTPIDKACPSLSSAAGRAYCRVPCDPNDSTTVTLLVRAPGADRVPGYESPVSVEVALRACKIDRAQISFTYKTLELALKEVLVADSKLAQAVTGRSDLKGSEATFTALQPFEQSAAGLQALAAENNPNFARFSHIMRDSEISAAQAEFSTKAVKWRGTATDYSVGTRSILLNDAATRSFGARTGKPLVPITKDPLQLYGAKEHLATELKKKPNKSTFDQVLEVELMRTTPMPAGKFAADKDIKAMDWALINRAQGAKER